MVGYNDAKNKYTKFFINLALYSILIVGIILFIICVMLNINEKSQKKNCNTEVKAEVIDIYERTVDDNTYYYNVYSYELDGEQYVVESNLGNGKFVYNIGDSINMFVNPDNPEEIYEESSILKFVYKLFGYIGETFIIFFIIAKIIMNRIYKNVKNNRKDIINNDN